MKKFHLPLSSWVWIPIISMIAAIFLMSCGPSTTPRPESAPTIQTNIFYSYVRWEITREEGIEAYQFQTADDYYTLVDEEWFKNVLMPGFNTFLFNNGITGGVNLKNDCDDFSRAFSFYCRVQSRRLGYIKSSLAVGDLYYKSLDVGHAINVAVVLDKNGNKKVIYIEPQGPSIVKLNEEIKKNYVRWISM